MTLQQIEIRRGREAMIAAWTKAAGTYSIMVDRFVGRIWREAPKYANA